MENRLSKEEIIAKYKEDVLILAKYQRWLMQKAGTQVATEFQQDSISKNSVSFPVYDSTLLEFVKVAEKTQFMNKNYVYSYSRNHLLTAKDELHAIEQATVMDMVLLGDILSKYIMKGRTKASLWAEGVEKGVYLALIKRMKEVLELWDAPKV